MTGGLNLGLRWENSKLRPLKLAMRMTIYISVGDRVCWNADKNDQGTVTEKNWAGVTVKWDNRSEQAILHNDMAQVERVPVKV